MNSHYINDYTKIDMIYEEYGSENPVYDVYYVLKRKTTKKFLFWKIDVWEEVARVPSFEVSGSMMYIENYKLIEKLYQREMRRVVNSDPYWERSEKIKRIEKLQGKI